MGVLLGSLFSRSRSLAQAWREAAVRANTSHHEGMEALARAAEAKDPTTGDHLFRCRDLAGQLAAEAGMGVDEAGEVAWSAMLHDIGKLNIPDRVLLKPGDLDEEEWALMRQHPIRGAEMLEHGQSLAAARRIARWHHENLDGSGYPDGLRGGAIPIEAWIVRVVDAWDAMTNDRPYRGAMTPSVRWRSCAGTPAASSTPSLWSSSRVSSSLVGCCQPFVTARPDRLRPPGRAARWGGLGPAPFSPRIDEARPEARASPHSGGITWRRLRPMCPPSRRRTRACSRTH